MAGSIKRRLITEKRGFRVKPIKHPRYKYVVYRIEDGRRVEQTYFQSERAANSHAYAQNIRLKNEGLEGQILGPELRGQAIEAPRRLARYGKSLRDAVDFYEIHLKTEASLREIKLEPFVRDFLNAKEEGKSGLESLIRVLSEIYQSTGRKIRPFDLLRDFPEIFAIYERIARCIGGDCGWDCGFNIDVKISISGKRAARNIRLVGSWVDARDPQLNLELADGAAPDGSLPLKSSDLSREASNHG